MFMVKKAAPFFNGIIKTNQKFIAAKKKKVINFFINLKIMILSTKISYY